MSLKTHKVQMSLLREGEEILHNCTSHWLIHLRLPLMYAISLLLPFIALFFMQSSGTITEAATLNGLWFLYSCYGLGMTTYFFLRCVNFELGSCVITNQRILRFGYKGLSQIVERDILPNKIEDVKVVKRGMLSMFFDAADIEIHTSNNEKEILRNVIQARKIQDAFTKLGELYRSGGVPKAPEEEAEGGEAAWIDDALGQSHGHVEEVSLDDHRDDTIEKIGDVFRGPKDI